MADYPILPPTLGALNATKNDPQGNEAASKLDDAIRQTRNWMYDYLSLWFDANGIKNAAFNSGSFPLGGVRGTDPGNLTNAGQREILQRSIQGIDIGEKAIGTQNIGDKAVGSGQIGDKEVKLVNLDDNAVGTAQVVDAAITAAKLGDGAVITNKIGNDQVTTAKVADEAITTAKIAERAVTGAELPEGQPGMLLIGGQTVNGVPNSFAPVALQGATLSVDGTIVVNPSTSAAFVQIAERAAQNSTASASPPTAAAWNKRGFSPQVPWSIIVDTLGQTVEVLNDKVFVKRNGTYLIRIHSPGYSCGKHRARLVVKPDANVATEQTYYGVPAASSDNTQGFSVMEELITFTNGATPNFPYFYVEHYIAALSTIGAGTPSHHTLGSPGNITGVLEQFATVTMIKVA